jgi:hypothetical protein
MAALGLQQPAVMHQQQKITAVAARFETNNMTASEDGRGVAVAEELGGKRSLLGSGRKRLQQGRGGSTLDGSRKTLQLGHNESWL